MKRFIPMGLTVEDVEEVAEMRRGHAEAYRAAGKDPRIVEHEHQVARLIRRERIRAQLAEERGCHPFDVPERLLCERILAEVEGEMQELERDSARRAGLPWSGELH